MFGTLRPRALQLGIAALVTGIAAAVSPAAAQEAVNLYTSRHYDTDERLYTEFTDATGIKVNRIEASADALIARIKNEGVNSPADVLLTTDAGRLWRAEQEGLLEPVQSDVLMSKIPAEYRHPDGLWFGFSTRARIIYVAKDRVDPSALKTYQDLADPKFKGQVCTRSSENIYMLSLMAGLIDHLGEEAARDWAAGVFANRAREPQGGDTDQLRGIVSGECDIALGNSYYFTRAMRLDVRGLSHPEDTAKIAVITPNQDSFGTHVNVSGGGLVKGAPNREAAVKFLEYLASPAAQSYFANGNDEFPVVDDIPAAEHVEKTLGGFKTDDLPLTVLGQNQAKARQLYDAAGYK